MERGTWATGGLVTYALLLLAGATTPQEATWLPPPVAEGAAQELAMRMRQLPELSRGREPDAERVLVAARRAVEAIAGVVTGWGVDGTIRRAPEFDGFKIAASGDRYLDAMARYQVCNVLLYLDLQAPALADDLDARITSTVGLSAVTLAVLSLREPFVAEGGDPAAIESLLRGPALQPAVEGLQRDPTVRAKAEAACQPVLVALLGDALESLDG